MKKSRLNEKAIVITFIFVGFVLFGLLGFNVYNDFIKDDSVKVKELDKTDLFGYVLDENDTKIYRKYFNELNKVLSSEEINYEEYAKLLSKLFVIDFYTLSNKVSSTDIGGLEFVYNDLLDNFKLNAGDTIYKYVESNIDGQRKQELPEVSDVIVNSVFDTKYTYDKKEYDSYIVDVNWTYKKDLGYQDKMKLNIIKDGTELYVVSGE